MCEAEVSRDGTSNQGRYTYSVLSPSNDHRFRPIAIPRTASGRETEYFDGSSAVQRYQHNCARCRILPLTEPQKTGTMYVLRVLDHRDIQMRVVIDARSGAITAVNRVVFQGPDSIVGTVPPPERTSPNEPPPATATLEPPLHDVAPDHATPVDNGGPPNSAADGDLSTSPSPSAMLSGTHSTLPVAPPLARPRPSNLKHSAKSNRKVPNFPSRGPW